jgi:hypothetical protein
MNSITQLFMLRLLDGDQLLRLALNRTDTCLLRLSPLEMLLQWVDFYFHPSESQDSSDRGGYRNPEESRIPHPG